MIKMRVETREYTVTNQSADRDVTGRRTQKTCDAACPFCGVMVKLYLWSLAGGGKLCTCGAKFQSGSRCVKVVPT